MKKEAEKRFDSVNSLPPLPPSLSVVLCYTHGSLAQCGGCSSATLNCGEGQCCTWDNPDVDTDPNSFSNSTRFPLGFVTSFIPRVESDDPLPCVTFTIPVIDRPRQNYIQVSIESTTDVW